MTGVDGAQRLVEVRDDPSDELVALGEVSRQRGGAPQQPGDGAALALQHLEQVEGELVDLLGLQGLEQRLEAVEQRRQVERRARARGRDRLARVLRPRGVAVTALLQRQVAVPDQVEEADLGAGGGGQLHVGLDPERDQGLRPLVVLDRADLADAHAGDADVVALLEHRGAGEDGGVLLPGAEPDVAHDGREQARHEHGDDGEDAELDRRRDRGHVALLGAHEDTASSPRTTGP